MTLPFAENVSSNCKRVLSGMRPTGRLHIGHFFGALQNWVRLQENPQYECFFFVADWHALTTDYAATSQIAQNSIEIATDWLASGIDPAKCTMFLQSSVPEHGELHLLLSMATPLGWLERVPTYKEALDNIKDKDLHTYGFLGYPVLQTADIVMYGQPGRDLVVPVGEDQVSHIEFSREIVRRFDLLYCLEMSDDLFVTPRKNLKTVFDMFGRRFDPRELDTMQRGAVGLVLSKITEETGLRNFLERIGGLSSFFSTREVLREPGAILTPTPRIPGTDGRKMSKSYGNFIALSESDDSIRAKTHRMITDPARKRRTDPGHPDECPVFDWHKLFSSHETISWASEGCVTAGIGCTECKAAVAENLIKWIEPVRARRKEYAADPAKVLRILDDGSEKAREVAKGTMKRVREAVFGWDKTRASLRATTAPAAGTTNAKAGD